MKKHILIVLAFLVLLTVSSCATVKTSNYYSQDEWASQKKFVELSTGIRMAYVEMGDPNGEVVILQHGMTDNSRSWSLAAPYFAEAGDHVYLPDLRGQGLSEETDGFYTTLTYATDLKAFFDAMNIDKAILIGHSLGSFTVQSFWMQFPERCSKVVLVSSLKLEGLQNEALQSVYERYVEILPDDGHPSDAFMDNWYACEIREDKYKDEFDTFITNLKKEAQSLSKSSWKNIILGLVASNFKDLYFQMDLSVPVLLLHGDEDTMARNEGQPSLIEALDIPETSYRNYLGVGHNIQFEIPEQCSNDIIGWLRTGVLPN